MINSTNTRSPHEKQLDALIAQYYEAVEQGHSVDQAGFLRQHPEFAAELREYLQDAGRLQATLDKHSANLSATIGTVLLKIRDYHLLSQIGAGGMGTVYLAMHLRLEKTVALKILKADRKRDSTSIARFEREMKSVGKLEHPHIVRALDAGDEGGTYFLVMEFLEGCDLGRLIKTKGRLQVPLACELIHQAALGLQHAHDHNLVHRDVKPSNLMLSTAGQVKVLDLGLAQLQVKTDESDEMTRAGEIVGTWRYMAPEQVLAGRQVDARSDIFSLGVTLYNLLVGELPLRFGQSATQLPPIATLRPDVPPDLQTLLGKMLAPNPSDRIQKMSEVAGALQVYESQGAYYIAAIKSFLNQPHPLSSNAGDATQSHASMASETKAIPPLFQFPAPLKNARTATLPTTSVPIPSRWRWRNMTTVTAAVVMTTVSATLAILALVMFGDQPPGQPPPVDPPGTIVPPVTMGTVILAVDDPNLDLPGIFAIRKGDNPEKFALTRGDNSLLPGEYFLIPGHPDSLIEPEQISVQVGKAKTIKVKSLPHVPWHLPRLPEVAGAYLEGRGTIWEEGMPLSPVGTPVGMPYKLTLTMGPPGIFVDEELGVKVAGNWLEVEVIQGKQRDYTETGRLLVDTGEYRRTNKLKVMEGSLTATSSDIVKRLEYLHLPQKNPPDRLAVKFLSKKDAIQDRAKELKIELPKLRISVQDVLAMLFDADFVCSSKMAPTVRSELATNSKRQGVWELVPNGPNGDLYCWVVKSEVADQKDQKNLDEKGNAVNLKTKYSYYRHEAVPFSMVKIEASKPGKFEANFTHTNYGTAGLTPPTPTPAELQACLALKPDLGKFDKSSLPLAKGAYVKYHVTITRHSKKQQFEVSLRMEDAVREESRNRLLEIDVYSTTPEMKFREQALLEIDLRDNSGVLTVKSGFLLNQDEVFEFEPGGDREVIDLGLMKLGKKPMSSLLTVHDVLALMFDAKLDASREIGGLRTGLAVFFKEPEFTFSDIGEVWEKKLTKEELESLVGKALAGAKGEHLLYRFTRSRDLPFDFKMLTFDIPSKFTLVCKLADSTTANIAAPRLLSKTEEELKDTAKETKSKIAAAEKDKNYREWRNEKEGSRMWAEFRGELPDGTVLLLGKQVSSKDMVAPVEISVPKQYLRREDQDWIDKGREWNAPGVQGFPRPAVYKRKTKHSVYLQDPVTKRELPPVAYRELSQQDQEWIDYLEKRKTN